MAADATSLVALGNELWGQGRWAEAAEANRRAARLEPGWSVPWYNLGLNLKRQRLWAESLDANRRATELNPEDGDAWWNLGIAATALGDWDTARVAWRGCGITVADGSGPPDFDLGPMPIRLNPDGEGEVVWAHRVDPARAILVNVPYPRSGYREGDTVLHDGAAAGYRMLSTAKIPVFDGLQVLEVSARRTTEASVFAPAEADVEALATAARDAGTVLEDWTASVRNLCRLCSEGVPHDEHEVREGWQPERHLGLSAADRADVMRLLAEWAAAVPGRTVRDVTHHG